MLVGGTGTFLALLALEQEAAALFPQVHQRHQDRARHRHAVGILEVIAAIAREVACVLKQWAEQFTDRVAGLLGQRGYACTDQPGELLGRQIQFVILDPEEITDAFEVESRRAALPAQVLVELCAVDRQLPANFGDRAVVAAGQFQVGSEMIAHGAESR
ncbi:hypothetical protein D9M71_561880 [compost metagenome]